VNANSKTVFEKKALADLKAGDVVSVISDKSPYTADTVTAEKVAYIGSPK
jgi:TusA-related sulfurtransferase